MEDSQGELGSVRGCKGGVGRVLRVREAWGVVKKVKENSDGGKKGEGSDKGSTTEPCVCACVCVCVCVCVYMCVCVEVFVKSDCGTICECS